MESTELVEEVISSVDYTDKLDLIIEYLDAINGLLFRFAQEFDFFIALVITIVFCIVYYTYLKYFTRF